MVEEGRVHAQAVRRAHGPRGRAPLHVEGVDGGGRRHDGRCEQLGQARDVEGRRGRDQAEVLAQQLTGLQREGEDEVGVELALVHLVEQEDRDPGQLGVAQQPAQQQARRHDLDAGARPDAPVAADGVPDRAADRFAEQRGHPGGRGPGCHAAGFGDDDAARDTAAGSLRRQRQGDERRLAGAGRRLQDRGPVRLQGGEELGDDGADRQRVAVGGEEGGDEGVERGGGSRRHRVILPGAGPPVPACGAAGTGRRAPRPRQDTREHRPLGRTEHRTGRFGDVAALVEAREALEVVARAGEEEVVDAVGEREGGGPARTVATAHCGRWCDSCRARAAASAGTVGKRGEMTMSPKFVVRLPATATGTTPT